MKEQAPQAGGRRAWGGGPGSRRVCGREGTVCLHKHEYTGGLFPSRPLFFCESTAGERLPGTRPRALSYLQLEDSVPGVSVRRAPGRLFQRAARAVSGEALETRGGGYGAIAAFTGSGTINLCAGQFMPWRYPASRLPLSFRSLVRAFVEYGLQMDCQLF